MRRFFYGMLVGVFIGGATTATAQEFAEGRGFLAEVRAEYIDGFGKKTYTSIWVWEPEPGVRCYTKSYGISCLRVDR